MTALDWVFTAIAVIWILEFILFRNRGTGEESPVERRSFLLILAALSATILAAALVGEMRRFEMTATWFKMIGILFFGTGVFLRYWGIIHLKAQFTRHVTVQEGDGIVSTGPYRKLRHPLYTGLLLIAVGMALFFQSILTAIIGGALVGWALVRRMDGEEELLVKEFGEEYREWMKRRARLIPFIY
ncbi:MULTISPECIES: methyltransferase family protein [Planomicrobium]|uniref:methyltransferase family protein n=1 Tax=Planomicrobium TaxID=162291 RepID=UPI000A02BE89|nr:MULTISPECIES: isoprenylcysteine carboxylmethyltransferase family protein [Planomicrobium]PKH08508.1 isoprenylcysteine carboxylmethyltransferase family protein [Planomicrobium sp. MB-3u-38]